ncbi:hypothetical protein DES34_10359 [Brevibacillus brevis]|uniref:hypothetical protein n=1 Tax=Brevibacillus brevis TaxID=1393 RepID=UPI000E38E6F6|nr:hypothetical protein [Brevibacillus brevis]RED32747.1 hypothetical protein DES34_10359 [Brevibacillus brevis]GEC91224.1 hypothetical protein BBR01nite_35550 [Brevibacillus brevis]VEF90420.1 Uncharacterised protein [Brevibacillus brevis]
MWGLSLSGTPKNEYDFVAGFSTISFEGVTSCLLEVSVYKPNENDFIKTNDGMNVRLTKSWGESLDYEEYRYHLGGALDWPSGYCQLGINATGKVRVSFETNDCV